MCDLFVRLPPALDATARPGPCCIEGGAAPSSGRGRRPRSGRPANRGHTCARTRHAVPRSAVRQKRPHADRYKGALRLAAGTESVRAHHSRWGAVPRGDVQAVHSKLGHEQQSLDCHSSSPLLHEACGFVLPHCDCEKLDCMVATLLIVLPLAIAREVVSHQLRRVRPRGSQPVPNYFAEFDADTSTRCAGYRRCFASNPALSQATGPMADLCRRTGCRPCRRRTARRHLPTSTLAAPLEYQDTPDGLASAAPETNGPRESARAAHAPREPAGASPRLLNVSASLDGTCRMLPGTSKEDRMVVAGIHQQPPFNQVRTGKRAVLGSSPSRGGGDIGAPRADGGPAQGSHGAEEPVGARGFVARTEPQAGPRTTGSKGERTGRTHERAGVQRRTNSGARSGKFRVATPCEIRTKFGIGH